MANEFKVGDVVQLKSGSPKMTAIKVGDNLKHEPTVWCDWFDGTDKKHGTFPPEALDKVSK